MSGTVPTTAAFSATFGQSLDAFRLAFYNAALRECKRTRLASLDEDQEARYLLDDAWNNGLIQSMLEMGFWYFATRTARLDADPDIVPNFGYQYVCTKPTDWVRTVAVCSDERFNNPITQILDESGYIYSDTPTIYFSYVSNDTQYGAAFGRWPPSFYNAATLYAASLIVGNFTADETLIKRVKQDFKDALERAKTTAAMNESAKFMPQGSWVRARRGNMGGGTDRGNTGSLYG